MTNRSDKYRRNPSLQRVRPVPSGVDMELQGFLNDLRTESGNAVSVKNENGTNTPIRIKNGRLEHFTNGAWQTFSTDAAAVTETETAEAEPTETEPARGVVITSSSTVSGGQIDYDTLDETYAGLDLEEQIEGVDNPNYNRLKASQLTIHTHTKSEITDFPTGITGTFEIDGYNYTFTNGILTAREAVNNG